MAFGAIQAVTGRYGAAGCFIIFRTFLMDESASAEDEDHLAAVLVSVHSDGCAWDEAALEYAVGAVEEHVGCKYLLTTLEFRQVGNWDFVEFYDHGV